MKIRQSYNIREFGVPERSPGAGRIDRRLLYNFDFLLMFLIIILTTAGMANLYSATAVTDLGLFRSQISWLPVCVGVMILFFSINYTLLEGMTYRIYLVVCALLLAVDLTGYTSHGAQRWLNIGLFKLQPSEFAKIALVLALVQYFYNNPNVKGYSLREVLAPLGLLILPFLMVIKQPDLGTAGLLILIAFTLFIYVGVRKSVLLWIAVVGSGSLPILWFFILKAYQKTRILTFFNPDKDPLRTGYHIKQSLIAVGSGRWFGTGYLKGTQSGLRFLPEQHTDFTFSVFAEEWGFVGSVLLLLLFLALIGRALIIASRSKDRFGTLLSVGIAALIFWQVAINVGMCLGIFPVVGVPLPFFSYGRSALLTIFISAGLLLNISSRRFMF